MATKKTGVALRGCARHAVGIAAGELPSKPYPGPLSLNDELREQPGLEANDSLRLLQCDVRTVLLERVRETSGFAVPWDRDFVLSADVGAFPLADVLSLLHRANKSGFLLFGYADHEKAVYLHRGEVVFAASNQGVDRLGECLFRSGILTLEQLKDAELGFAGGLDPAEVEARARKIGGDRERYVRSALGEMITYLEFELRNHPRIEDPGIYLDAVEGLRATLDI
ncbi:MAG: DUF4388 domain-containing protein [Myxococcota bacterium]|nr:DUF4388 domain-containing protein [Myxococcota bacterium]